MYSKQTPPITPPPSSPLLLIHYTLRDLPRNMWLSYMNGVHYSHPLIKIVSWKERNAPPPEPSDFWRLGCASGLGNFKRVYSIRIMIFQFADIVGGCKKRKKKPDACEICGCFLLAVQILDFLRRYNLKGGESDNHLPCSSHSGFFDPEIISIQRKTQFQPSPQ